MIVSGGAGAFDWDSFTPTTYTGTAPTRTATKTVGPWTFAAFEDAEKSNDTQFVGGTKQDDNCAAIKTGSMLNKDEALRVYLAAGQSGSDDDVFLNLAWVRPDLNSQSASTHLAFEFNAGETPCVGSPKLVDREPGDFLILYDFEGGNEAPIIRKAEWLEATAPANCNNPPNGSSVSCWSTYENLTAAGLAEAGVNVAANVTDNIAPSPPKTLKLKSFGEAGINLTDSGIFDPNTCQSFGNAYAVSRTSGNSADAAMKDIVGPGPFRISNCGTLIVKKVSIGGQANFSFTSNIPSNSTFDISTVGKTNSTDQKDFPDLLEGTYNIAETVPAGWNLDSATCDNGDVPSAVSVTPDVTVTCTFTNSAKATLRIDKVTNPSGHSASFSFSQTVNGDGPFTLTDAQAPKVFANITPSQYTITEAAANGWALTGRGCRNTADNSAHGFGNSGNTGISVTLLPGEDVTCTFTNTGQATLRIDKVTNPSGSTQSFTFGQNADNSGDFNLTDASTPKAFVNILPGSYIVNEKNIPTGWVLTGRGCVNTADNSVHQGDTGTAGQIGVTLGVGEDVTCTFTNTQNAKVAIHKVDDDDPANPVAGAVFKVYEDLTPPSASAPGAEDLAGPVVAQCTTDASGDCASGFVLTPGTHYWVVETTTPTGYFTADPQRILAAAGGTNSITFTDPRQFKVITIVCRVADNSLYQSSVTFDGQTKSSLDGTGLTAAQQAALCGLGGATFSPKLYGNYTGSVNIPQ